MPSLVHACSPTAVEILCALRPHAAANDDRMREVPLLFVETGYRSNAAGTRLSRIRRVDASSRTEAARLLRHLRAAGYRATRYLAGRRRAYRVMRRPSPTVPMRVA